MILQKKYYIELKKLLENNVNEEYLNYYLKQINDELLYEILYYYKRKNKDKLNQYLSIGNRYQKLFSSIITENKGKKYCSIALLIGEFNGIMKVIDKLINLLIKEENTQNIISLCKHNNYIKEMLQIIYRNPSIRHKDLLDKMEINSFYLNKLVELLIPTKSINKYGFGSNCYYELTLEGRYYVEKYLEDNIN